MPKTIIPGLTRFRWTGSAGATSYRIHWGTSAGTYSNSLSVGDVLLWPAHKLTPNLANGTTYYVACTAWDGSTESDYSNEIQVLNGTQIA